MSTYLIKGKEFTAGSIAPGLYIAATPIGNLGDITLRVLETLSGCDLIACEDTRVTRKLLNHYGITTKPISYHEHNADSAGPRIIEDLDSGKSVVLVSDAGTPIVSDPGSRLVDMALAAGHPVWPLPGASAPLAALVAANLPCETWSFAGFLPTKQGARKSRLQDLSAYQSTLVFFESPNRVSKTLNDMENVLGPDRQAVVARELTKLHEEFSRGTLQELSSEFYSRSLKGEVVILVGPPNAAGDDVDPDALLTELMQEMSVSRAAAQASELTGKPKRDLYQRALELKDDELKDEVNGSGA